jgi:transposase InsO family protein
VDIRYLDMHDLSEGMIYCISILEGYSRAILASAVTRRQTFEAYIAVFYAAIRKHGCPKALVSDHGRVFRDHRAMPIYRALGIEKLEIEKRQSWQNLIETALYVIWNLENSQITYIMWTTSAFLLKSFQRMAGVFHIINVQRRMADWCAPCRRTWNSCEIQERKGANYL